MRFITNHILIALFASSFGTIVYASEPDIAGLKLGMSPEQAKAALVAFGIDTDKIQETVSSYRYTDGVNSHNTVEFLDRITASTSEFRNGKRIEDVFELSFAPPPEGGQLVRVYRQSDNPVDPPTVGEYRAAIFDKYGPPDEDNIDSTLKWLNPHDAVACTITAPREIKDIMSSIYNGNEKYGWRLHQLKNANKVSAPAQCARILEYKNLPSYQSNQPAKSVIVTLVDVPGWGTAYLATLEWIETQRQAAVKQREGRASKPKL